MRITPLFFTAVLSTCVSVNSAQRVLTPAFSLDLEELTGPGDDIFDMVASGNRLALVHGFGFAASVFRYNGERFVEELVFIDPDFNGFSGTLGGSGFCLEGDSLFVSGLNSSYFFRLQQNQVWSLEREFQRGSSVGGQLSNESLVVVESRDPRLFAVLDSQSGTLQHSGTIRPRAISSDPNCATYDFNGNRFITHTPIGCGDSDGTVQVFVREGVRWVREAELIPRAFRESGSTFSTNFVALEGDVIACTEPSTGNTYVFERVEEVWKETAALSLGSNVLDIVNEKMLFANRVYEKEEEAGKWKETISLESLLGKRTEYQQRIYPWGITHLELDLGTTYAVFYLF